MPFWTTNLAALDRRKDAASRALAERLGSAGPAPDGGLRDRSGTVLPSFEMGGGSRSLISSYDPTREAERWAEDLSGATVAVLGGAGVALYRALRLRSTPLLFWIEPRPEVWRALLTWQDWTEPLGDDRWVPIVAEGAPWTQELRMRYQPVWDGGFHLREWRAAVQGQESRWQGFRDQAVSTLEAIASDASTQARFGERWYRNTLVNLERLEQAEVPGCSGARVVVAGAGPALEDELADLVNQRWLEDRERSGDRLFATDTALPALTRRGLVPDLVLCLDGQLPSYHHFVPPPPQVPLVADLASLPSLARRGMPVVRYLSGHPFGAVIRRFFPELPVLDGSLANVSGLARNAALALGAREVSTWGVDFRYCDGKAYARGTYVYDLAARRADRLAPGETRLGASCYGDSGIVRTRSPQGSAWDTTPLLRVYRSLWERAPTRLPQVTLHHGSAQERWQQFLVHWKQRLTSLPLPAAGQSMQRFLLDLAPSVKEDWWALWPLALALHRQGVAAERLPLAVVERAWTFLQD